jgi:CheY-like chemotaxis protein
VKRKKSATSGQIGETRRSKNQAADLPVAVFTPKRSWTRKVLVIDDTLMLLRFVEEILTEANYQVTIAPNAEEGLRASKLDPPDLVLLDYILPDIRGDEVSRKLLEDPVTADIPVVQMTGFGADVLVSRTSGPNVIGFLNKPFSSDLLIKTVETHMPKPPAESESTEPESRQAQGEGFDQPEQTPFAQEEFVSEAVPAPQGDEWWSAQQVVSDWADAPHVAPDAPPSYADVPEPEQSANASAFFCGDTSFFSLHWALRTIAKEKLTGVLRAFWQNASVDLLARDGQILLVTTRDPDLYCSEAPITLANVDAQKVAEARARQTETNCPLFITLEQEQLILRDPALQLVQHYGQKLFAQLWTAQRVRFMFEQTQELPPFAYEVTPEVDVDHWALGCLRFIQFQDLGDQANYDAASIPAYTRDGFQRVQELKLTVAEAQFASQFNGVRSIAQIGRNLRLDIKFARLTLFRFLALEIVECWPPAAAPKPENKSIFQRFSRLTGSE